MPRGRTKSKLNREDRMYQAFDGFSKGLNDTEIAKKIHVTRQTVGAYRRKYELKLSAAATANPSFLRDVVTNTMKSLQELDRIRADAWQHMEPRKTQTEHECPECGVEFSETEYVYVSDDTRSKYMGHLLKAQEMRSKLMGVLGIKTDVFVAVMQVKVVAEKLMSFMSEELCANDREKLAEFLMSPEIAQFMTGSLLDAVDAEVIEDRELSPAS